MADVKYQRATNRFDCLGLDLNRPVDSVKPGKFPFLKNLRSFLAGRIEPRDGLTDIAEVVAGQTPVHSCRRLNDPANSTYTRIVGAGTHLAYEQGSFTDLDSGYSGDPLALTPWKPLASPNSYMYVADRLRMRKVSPAGSLHTIGLPAPAAPPVVNLTDSPSYKVLDTFQATTGWAGAGTAGAPSTTTRISTTIAQILYDQGVAPGVIGWACISPTAGTNIGPGARVIINSGGGTQETVTVQANYPGSVSTTVASIIYDSGTTGLCSIVLTTAIDQVAGDALIRNSTVGPENARILSVAPGPNGSTSIRLSTFNTWAATNAIQVIVSFRAYCVSSHAPTETITELSLRTAVTNGTGTLTKTAALDLSLIATGIPAHPDDYMHVSLRVSDQTVITELKLLLDVDATTNDFTRNFYSYSVRASDLTPSASNLQSLLTTRQQILQRQIIDTPVQTNNLQDALDAVPADFMPGAPLFNRVQAYQAQQKAALQQDQAQLPQINDAISAQLDAGASQYVEIQFPISALVRIGTDLNRTLANVATIRLTALVTGNVNIDIDSWWIGGGYGPDTYAVSTAPYFYRYRARNPATNVPSNFSPATRYRAFPERQSVTVLPTQYPAPSGTSLSTADFVLDIERFGGNIADWHYVGTIPNAATPTFADIYDDDIVGGQPIIDNSNYQPWPILGTPVSGTTGTVSGTTFNDSSTTFNLSWAPGTRILINNQPYTIYRVISTSRLETVENATSQSAVSWRIDEPTILAQPLPCLWEWDNTFFACGDPINPGRLYYSNPESETTVSTNYLDITSPSEPLMNGLQYNIRSYLFSSENMFQIVPTNNPASPYLPQRIPNGKGLFSRWLLTREPAPVICFGARDGLNMTTGGAPIALTDADLYDLFPSEGNPGQDVNGVLAPDISLDQSSNLRLAYYDEYLYFDYPSISSPSTRATLVLAFDLGAASRGEAPGGWFYDIYAPNAQFHYGDEGAGVHAILIGGTDSHLYQYTGDSDNGTPFLMELLTPSLDMGEPRANKLFGDIMLDVDTDGLNVLASPLFNNNSSPIINNTLVNTASRTQLSIPFDASWVTAKNISINLLANISDSRKPLYYIWEPRWTFESAPISSYSWEISPSTFGMENFKSIGICKITHVSPADIYLLFTIDNIAQTPILIPASGGANYVQTIFRTPVYKGKLYKARISSVSEFRLDTRDSFFEVKDWGSDGPYSQLRIFSDYAMVEG